MRLYTTTFAHIYYTNGSAIKPKSTHGCMQSGYWCGDQVKEEGEMAIVHFLKRKGIRNPKTVIKTIKKLK